jgi:hypothetical protein
MSTTPEEYADATIGCLLILFALVVIFAIGAIGIYLLRHS